MQWYHILFLSIFGILVVTMLVMKICKLSSGERGIVKMLMSCGFVVVAIYATVKSNGGLAILATVGLVFAALGDLFLVFDGTKSFAAGVVSFSVTSVCLFIFSLLKFGWSWWAFGLFVLVESFSIVGQIRKLFNYGSLKVYLNVYTVLVSLCGMFGLTLLFQAGNLSQFLFGLGCIMYYCSDICLALYMFRFRHCAMDAANSLLYFPGILLVAISLLL